MKMRGDRRNKELLAQGIRGIYRGSLTGDGQRVTASYDDAMDVLRHVAEGREAGLSPEIAEPVWRELIARSIAHEFRVFDAQRK